MHLPFSVDAAPNAPLPQAGERVLVVAPHPDDESLGAGGWIYSARQQGADVRILFLTDGDAFRLAAFASDRRIPDHDTCRALGKRRRNEATSAAAVLGVAQESVQFLGYPDRGLSDLRRRWSPLSPYRSPHTGRIAGVDVGERSGKPYCGQALLEDLVAVMGAFCPDYLLFADADDDHCDHRATAWFTALALSKLADQKPRWVASYLIHYGLWPVPHRFVEAASLLPPTRLRGKYWEVSFVNREALQAKSVALRSHASQHLWAADLFGAHLRDNELFRRR